jgi:hypothetical protein
MIDHNDIKLEGFDKLFEYEKHCRMIDNLDYDELKDFAKLYCKLYMKQQEVLSSLGTL